MRRNARWVSLPIATREVVPLSARGIAEPRRRSLENHDLNASSNAGWLANDSGVQLRSRERDD